ncbi:MAG TPA: chemotaxis protein CheW [Patescibacteria group bacterium]|nr:chemotaxis protein CheW [Patescibacteria group bacterium]
MNFAGGVGRIGDNAVLATGAERQLVVFRLAREEYGLPITKVQEINRVVPTTRLPQMPSFLEGIINLRGRIIPVVDMRKRFQLGAAEHTEDSRIIVVEACGQTIGIVVDAVHEVITLSEAGIEPAPPASTLDEKFLQGVGKVGERLLLLLDIDQVIGDPNGSVRN